MGKSKNLTRKTGAGKGASKKQNPKPEIQISKTPNTIKFQGGII